MHAPSWQTNFMNEREIIIFFIDCANVRSTLKVFYFGKHVLYCKRSNNTQRDQFLFHEGHQEQANMRTSMTQEILSPLALLHTHYDVPIDLDKTVDIYSRLALDSLIKPYNAVTHNIMFDKFLGTCNLLTTESLAQTYVLYFLVMSYTP